ncbi:CDGSH iron-sulfur domain-containing protein [Streptomyces sp. NPDC057494]|uniref:CDGSH iron-sulfur domain-containing protein n=1 Tax=Streptomyces sp. NPDC057494 TaxID=3346148 RepID=UPI00369C1955
MPGTADDDARGRHGGPVRRVCVDPQGPVLIEGPVEVVLEDGSTALSDRFMTAVRTFRRSRTHPWCATSTARASTAPAPHDGSP